MTNRGIIMATKGVPKKDGSGQGKRANRGRVKMISTPYLLK